MIPLYHHPQFTFRFADDRIIPRFHLEGFKAGQRVSVYKIDAVTCERTPTLTLGLMTISEWLAQHDEGFLLPDRPPLKRMPRINTTPFTDAQRKRLHPKKVKPPKPFAPTVQKVKEIVPNKLIPKLKPG